MARGFDRDSPAVRRLARAYLREKDVVRVRLRGCFHDYQGVDEAGWLLPPAVYGEGDEMELPRHLAAQLVESGIAEPLE